MLKNERVVEFDYRNAKCRLRIRLTLIAVLTIAAILGSAWSRQFIDRRAGQDGGKAAAKP